MYLCTIMLEYLWTVEQNKLQVFFSLLNKWIDLRFNLDFLKFLINIHQKPLNQITHPDQKWLKLICPTSIRTMHEFVILPRYRNRAQVRFPALNDWMTLSLALLI